MLGGLPLDLISRWNFVCEAPVCLQSFPTGRYDAGAIQAAGTIMVILAKAVVSGRLANGAAD
jgi:hypothetical protein